MKFISENSNQEVFVQKKNIFFENSYKSFVNENFEQILDKKTKNGESGAAVIYQKIYVTGRDHIRLKKSWWK